MMSRSLAAIFVLAVMLSGCSGCDSSASMKPITVRLSWTGPADLDLLIDETPAYRQGGSADQQSGSEENFTIPRGAGNYIIAVQNLSGHASATPQLTIEGVSEATGSLIIPFSKEPFTMQGSVEPKARRDRWVVCSVDAAKGEVTKINQWE